MGNILNEKFENGVMDKSLKWYCEPSNWKINGDRNCLELKTDAGTDYWQKTGYGFEVDNGHFLFTEVEGDFTLMTKVDFYPVNQYDQAGLMVRLSKNCWLKTSVEYENDEPAKLGAVVTNNGYSDWAVQNFPPDMNSITLRIIRKDADYTVEFFDKDEWKLLRLAHLMEDEGKGIKAGLYACSPKGSGYRAEFEYLTIED